MTRIELSNPILQQIGGLASAKGLKVYVVGGVVRDILLGKAVTDIDISVEGDGIAFAHVVHETFNTSRVVEFTRFNTARLIFENTEIEFVGTRKEEYSEHSRKPKVVVGSIDDDMRRRDFTVNAMAASLLPDDFGRLIDPFNGRADLQLRQLKTPLAPETTFSDDPLRMMRAFRFAAQLDFTIATAELAAIHTMRERITIVSVERVRDELLKLLATAKPSLGLAPMQESGLLEYIFPELSALAGVDQHSLEYPGGVRYFHHKDVFYHTLEVLDNLSRLSENTWLRIAALLHDIAKPKTKAFVEGIGWTFHGHAELGARMVLPMFRQLKLPLEPVPFVKKMVLLHLRPIALINEEVSDAAIRRLLVDAGEHLGELLDLCRSDITSKNPKLVKKYLRNYDILVDRIQEVEERDKLRNWQPPLDGDTIMRVCNIQPGIAVGVLKTRIEDAVLDGRIPNDRQAALEYLLTIKDEVLASSKMIKPPSRKSQLHSLPKNLR